MLPIDYFKLIWQRCDELSAMHAFLSKNLTSALSPNELLRAEWAGRVSALDLYIHEVVSQRMLDIFNGARPTPKGFLKFKITNDLLVRITSAPTPQDRSAAFDLFIRESLTLTTYQFPEQIADGIRLVSEIELWNEIAIKLGATASTKTTEAKRLKKSLSIIIDRRNKIVHEGDLQPSTPRIPWPITPNDLIEVRSFLEILVNGIDAALT